MEVCWPPTCTCMRMQVVKSPVHMPSVTAKRWGVGFFTFNSEVISNCSIEYSITNCYTWSILKSKN